MRSQCPVTIHNKTINAETSNDAVSAGVKRPQHPNDILKEHLALKPLLISKNKLPYFTSILLTMFYKI